MMEPSIAVVEVEWILKSRKQKAQTTNVQSQLTIRAQEALA